MSVCVDLVSVCDRVERAWATDGPGGTRAAGGTLPGWASWSCFQARLPFRKGIYKQLDLAILTTMVKDSERRCLAR